MPVLDTVNTGCLNISAEDCWGWIRHEQRFFPMWTEGDVYEEREERVDWCCCTSLFIYLDFGLFPFAVCSCLPHPDPFLPSPALHFNKGELFELRWLWVESSVFWAMTGWSIYFQTINQPHQTLSIGLSLSKQANTPEFVSPEPNQTILNMQHVATWGSVVDTVPERCLLIIHPVTSFSSFIVIISGFQTSQTSFPPWLLQPLLLTPLLKLPCPLGS